MIRASLIGLLSCVLSACVGSGDAVDASLGPDASLFDADVFDDATDASLAEWPVLPECRFDYPGAEIREHEFLERSAGTVTFRLWRCYADQGAGRSAIYRADRFELVFDGVSHRATTDEIQYTNTHHNWQDTLVAESGSITLHWETRWSDDTGVRYYAWATASSGEMLLPETEFPNAL